MEATKNDKNLIFWGGIIIGFTVMITGIFLLILRDIGTAEARLILCSGLGILFGAFGSTATIKYKGVTMTGVAATAIILLYVVVNLTSSKATFGKITGDIRGAQIEIVGETTFLGAMGDRTYDFVVPGSELNRSVFDVFISFPPNVNEEGEQEINFQDIDKKYIERAMGSGERIEWRFDRMTQRLIETSTGNTVCESGFNIAAHPTKSNTARSFPSLIGLAFAQKVPRSIEEIFADLGSGSTSVRRAARDELASKGPLAVKDMMNKLKQSRSQYRIRVGILYALRKVIRDDPDLAGEVSRHLSDEDLKVLIEALNDPDRTIRKYAGEFLYYLHDPRVIEPALLLADKSISLESYNLFNKVIDRANQSLTPSMQHDIKAQMQIVQNSLNFLKIGVQAFPSVVSPGQKSTITVNVLDGQNRVVSDAEVIVTAGGGKFLSSANTYYDPKSRLHGPYSATGRTNIDGKFTTWWVCNPCAAGYSISVRASKADYIDAEGEILIRIHKRRIRDG